MSTKHLFAARWKSAILSTSLLLSSGFACAQTTLRENGELLSESPPPVPAHSPGASVLDEGLLGLGTSYYVQWQNGSLLSVSYVAIDVTAAIALRDEWLKLKTTVGPAWNPYEGNLTSFHTALGLRAEWEGYRGAARGVQLMGDFFTGEDASSGWILGYSRAMPPIMWMPAEFWFGYGRCSVRDYKQGFNVLSMGILVTLTVP